MKEGRHRLCWCPLERTSLNHWVLCNGPNRVGVSLLSPQDGNRFGFRNHYLEFTVMGKVQKPNNSEMDS
jgi:hypothetical protein